MVSCGLRTLFDADGENRVESVELNLSEPNGDEETQIASRNPIEKIANEMGSSRRNIPWAVLATRRLKHLESRLLPSTTRRD